MRLILEIRLAIFAAENKKTKIIIITFDVTSVSPLTSNF